MAEAFPRKNADGSEVKTADELLEAQAEAKAKAKAELEKTLAEVSTVMYRVGRQERGGLLVGFGLDSGTEQREQRRRVVNLNAEPARNQQELDG